MAPVNSTRAHTRTHIPHAARAVRAAQCELLETDEEYYDKEEIAQRAKLEKVLQKHYIDVENGRWQLIR